MINIGSKLKVMDNSGGKLAKCINIVGKKKKANVGSLLTITLSKCVNNKKVKKRNIYLGLIISVKYWTFRIEGSFIKFFSNRILIFSKKYKFLGTRVYGVVAKEIKLTSFNDTNYYKFYQKVISYSSLII